MLEAKDQGHMRKCSQKKKNFQKIFQAKMVLNNFFSGDIQLRKTKKRSSQIFHKVSIVFQQNFNGLKNSAVLEPRTGQFSRT